MACRERCLEEVALKPRLKRFARQTGESHPGTGSRGSEGDTRRVN